MKDIFTTKNFKFVELVNDTKKFINNKLMNRVNHFLLIFLLIFSACNNSNDAADKKAKIDSNKIENNNNIKWLNIDELEKAILKKPKDILVMVYAPWCEESKKYHNTTYKNEGIINYINNNYYAALVNAEEEDTINFRGKKYAIHPNTGHNEIVYELKARSIPSLVFLDKDFNIQGSKNGFTDVPLLDELLFQYKNNY